MSLPALRLHHGRTNGDAVPKGAAVAGATPPFGCPAGHRGGRHVRFHPNLAKGRSRSINPVPEGHRRAEMRLRSRPARPDCHMRHWHHPALVADAQPYDRKAVGARALLRLDEALNPFRDGLLVWERPEGAGPGVRIRARPRTRSRPSDCRVAPSPVRVSPAAPAARDSEAQDCCAQQLPSPRRCARLGRRGAHRHPLSISRACTAMTHGARGAQIIGRGLPRGEPSAMCRRVCISPGWSASPEHALSMTTRWATTSTAALVAAPPRPPYPYPSETGDRRSQVGTA